MPTFTRYKPQSEKELHQIIKNELDALEEGLRLLQYEYPSGTGIIDLLCVDSGGRLAIIEVKLYEDENILFQALRYYNDIYSNRYLVANLFREQNVDPDQDPRIILIAERFSDDIRNLSTLVVPEIELFGHSVLQTADGERGIAYYSVALPAAPSPPSEPRTIDDLLAYLRKDELLPVVAQMREDIKRLVPGAEEYPTSSYIGYRHHTGRQFAYIRINRKSVEIGAHIIAENKALLDYEGIRVENRGEDYSSILEEIAQAYRNLEG